MKPIKTFDLILLFFSATAYQFANDVPTFDSKTPYRNKAFASFIVFVLEFTLVIFLSRNVIYLSTAMLLVILGAFYMLEVCIRFYFDKQLETLTSEYYNYYSGYLYALFVILLLAGVGYGFYTMIG